MRLTQFGNYSIPQYSKRDVLDTSTSGGALVQLPGGGSYDSYGLDTAPQQTHTISTRFELIATTTALMQTYRDAVRALRGRVARLWATMPDGSWRYVWARCTQVRMDREWNYNFFQPVELTFEIKQPGWRGGGHGAPWYFDSGEYFETGLYFDLDDTYTLSAGSGVDNTLTINNAGNSDVTQVTLTVHASTSADITWMIVTVGDCSWRYEGTIEADMTLTVDCGAKSVVNNGNNDYANFALRAVNADSAWMRLVPGDNTVTITLTGGSTDSTATFTFWDGWE